MYRFLSAVYLHPPGKDLARRLADRKFLAELSHFLNREGLAELGEFAATPPPVRDRASLKQEYMDLFAVPTGRYVAPFEDLYRGQSAEGELVSGPLLGERAIAVRRMYREAGAEMERTCRELPTHIGVELSFMSFLCSREKAAITVTAGGVELPDRANRDSRDYLKWRGLQVRFLHEHLNAWFPQLSRAIRTNTRSPFYRGLALVTGDFLAMDTAGLTAPSRPETHLRERRTSQDLPEGEGE
jgi:TorA maturation chaperone TorD